MASETQHTTESPHEAFDALGVFDAAEILGRIVDGVATNSDDPVPYWLASQLNDRGLIDYAAWEKAVRGGQTPDPAPAARY